MITGAELGGSLWLTKVRLPDRDRRVTKRTCGPIFACIANLFSDGFDGHADLGNGPKRSKRATPVPGFAPNWPASRDTPAVFASAPLHECTR